MKAIKSNNKTFELTGERGDYFITKDERGKVKMFLKKDVEVIEVECLQKKTYKTKKSTSVNSDPVQTWQEIALSVNDQWNNNSYWKLAENKFGKLNTNGNEFIESLLKSMFENGKLSEKQAYYLAKYGVESGQLN